MGNKHVGKQKTLQTEITVNNPYDTTLLASSLWTSGVLNGVFVYVPVHPQWTRSLQ